MYNAFFFVQTYFRLNLKATADMLFLNTSKKKDWIYV